MQGFLRSRPSFLPLLLLIPLLAALVILAASKLQGTEAQSFSGAEKRAIARTDLLLAGIPQRGAALGDPDAPVTLQFFGDLQCLQSRRAMLGALPFLIRHWVRDGKLRIVYRSRKSDTPGWPEFVGQHSAAMAAGMQGKMWSFVNLFYREQGPEFSRYADDAFLEKIAKQADLNLERWGMDREPTGWSDTIQYEGLLADSKNLVSTPSFLIGPTGGRAEILRHFSLEEPKVFDDAIEELL
jgi:protein-disulfide isomerase